MRKNNGLIGVFLTVGFLGFLDGMTNLLWGGDLSKIGWSQSSDPIKKAIFNFCLALFGFLIATILHFRNRNKQ